METAETIDQQPEQQDPQPPKKYKVSEFASKIKKKYPDYQNVPDAELVQKIINKYPEYKEQVDLTPEPEKKKESGTLPSSNGQSQLPPTENIAPQSEPEPPSVQEDALTLARKADALEGKTIFSRTGGFGEGVGGSSVPDEAANAEGKKINDELRKQGFEPKKLIKDFEDIPDYVHKIPGYEVPQLLQLSKENPEKYERTIGAIKGQVFMGNELDKLPPQEGQAIKKDFNESIGLINSMESSEDKTRLIQRVMDMADKYGGDDKDKIKRNLGIDFGYVYGKLATESDMQLSTPTSQVNKEVALRYINDIHPEQLRKYSAAFLKDKDVEGNPEREIATELANKELEEIGINLRRNYLNEKLNPLKKEYDNLVYISNVRYLTDEEKQRAAELEKSGTPLFDAMAQLQEQEKGLIAKYPRTSYMDAENFAQEFIGQKSTGLERFMNKTGEAVHDLGAGIYDMIGAPLSQDNLRQADIIGADKINETTSYLKQSNQINQTFKPQVSEALQVDIDAISNNKLMDYDQKSKALTKLLLSRTGEWQRTPMMRTNLGLKSLMYGISDMAASLVPFIGAEMVTGGGATAGFLRKFTSTFISAAATGFEESYKDGIKRGEANPYAYATRVTAINSAAIAGAQTPQAIRNMFKGQKTAVGELVAKMTDTEIESALKATPKAFKSFSEGLKILKDKSLQAGKNFGSAALSGTKDAAKINTFMTGGRVVNDAVSGELRTPEEYAKDFAIETLKFALPSSIIGGVSKTFRPTDMSKAALYEVATNKDGMLSALDQKLKDGTISQQEGLEVRRNIETASKIYEKNSPVFKTLDDKAKREYIYNAMIESKAKEAATGLPDKQAEKFEMQAEIAKHKNGLLVEPKTPEQLEKRKAQLEKSLIPEKDAEGKNIEVPEKEVFAAKAEIAAIDEVLDEHSASVADSNAKRLLDKKEATVTLDEKGEEVKPDDTANKIPHVETHESVMERAKTGQPIEIDALRIQQSEKSNEDTGAFYGDKGVIEEYQRRQKSGFYGKGNENLFKGDVKQNKLKFDNPLVVESKEEFIKELAENGDKEAREVMPDYKETDPAKLVTTHKTHKDFDIFIAKKAREKGHDGIITPLEYIDLRKSENKPTTTVSSEGKDAVTIAKENADSVKIGIYKDVLKNGDEQAAKDILKEVSEQWHDERSRKQTEENFGQPIVDAAKEMFPMESHKGVDLPPSEPVEPTAEEPFVEGKRTELSHRGLQEVATEFGLEDVRPRDRVTDVKLHKDVKDTIVKWSKEGKYADNVERLIKEAEEGGALNAEERLILQQHLANLREETNAVRAEKGINSPEYDKKLKELSRLKEAGQIVRSTAGAALRIPDIQSIPDNTMEGWMTEKMESTGSESLTPEQKAEVEKQFNDYEAKAKDADEKLAQATAKIAELKAENELLKTKKSAARGKKKEALKSERSKIVESIQDKLKKARGENKVTILPYANELFAIAPDVAKLVKNLVETGAIKLADVIDAVHDTLKKDIPQITKDDVRDIIAGQYNKERPTKTALQAQLKDLRDEAVLIKKLEDLMNNVPTDPKKIIKRNQEITDLQNKIKDFKKENPQDKSSATGAPRTPKEQIEAVKNRNISAKKKLEERIANGDFETEKKIPFNENAALKNADPKLYKQAMDAIVAKEEARHKFDLAKRQDELSKRSKVRKVLDFASKIVSTSKAIKAGIDDSVTFVQLGMAVLANPSSAGKAKVKAFQAVSDKNFKRQLADLHSSPYWDTVKNSGLDITEPKSLSKEKLEETYSGNMIDNNFKIKGKEYNLWKHTGGIFERMFTSMANNLRLNMFLKRMEFLENQGKTFDTHPEEYKAAARVINELTGRGKVNEHLQSAMPVISPIIWAPRMLASTINTLGIGDLANAAAGKKGYYRSLTPQQRKYAGVQLAKGLSVGISVMTALAMSGWQVDSDPQSSTFGNVKHGTTSYNVFGRYAGFAKTLIQVVTGKKKTAAGETNLDDPNRGRGAVVGKFFRGKMTPFAGVVYDYILNSQQNSFTREPMTGPSIVKDMLTPISIADVKKGLDQDGAMSLLTRWLPAVEGIQVMDDRDFESKNAYTTDELKLPQVKMLKDKGIDMPLLGSIKQHKITVDKAHPDGLMTEKEYEAFKEKKKKYILEGLKDISNAEWLNTTTTPDGEIIEKEEKTKDLSKELLKKQVTKISTEATKRALEELGLSNKKAETEMIRTN
jgi:hypothetical protein